MESKNKPIGLLWLFSNVEIPNNYRHYCCLIINKTYKKLYVDDQMTIGCDGRGF